MFSIRLHQFFEYTIRLAKNIRKTKKIYGGIEVALLVCGRSFKELADFNP